MVQSKPPFLYHGRQFLVDIIKPEQAQGQWKGEDQLCAVYASHLRQMAIPFALPITPDANGECLWGFNLKNEKPRIKIRIGWLNPLRIGYLYRVPLDTFVKIDEHQWVSSVPVVPLDYEEIHPWDYLHWFETTKVILKPGTFERRRKDERFALAITLSRILNSLVSTWRLHLSYGELNSVIAQREKMQAFLNGVAVLHEGIKTFCDNQKHLKDFEWFKTHLDDIDVINKENGGAGSFNNVVMKAVRNNFVFHFDRDVENDPLLNPDVELADPIVLTEGISPNYGESVHPLADKLIEEFLIHIWKQSHQESVDFVQFLRQFDELQGKFVNVIGPLIAELVKDDIEIGE